MTPPEVWADREPASVPDGPGWRVRVVPNKFPAFAGPVRPAAGNGPGDLYRAGPTAGVHEVIVHSPDHAATLADMAGPDAARVVAAWRLRLAARRGDDLGAAVVIVNQGRLSGASLEHPHSQLFATAARPELVQAELERLGRDDCAACAVLNKERGGERVVADAAGLVTLCPWASAAPFEAMVLPEEHLPRLDDQGGPGDVALAAAVGRLLRGLGAVAGARAPYNLVLHAAPPGIDDFHWHLHLLPRLTAYGGFELATGIVINVIDPDQAASALRVAAGVSGS
jgi:UDPglucose--hexose-1-phosphate uridylyltransferase